MLSVIIIYKFSYSALLKKQPIHQGFAFLGPLVLENNFFNFLTYAVDRDQTVSRTKFLTFAKMWTISSS